MNSASSHNPIHHECNSIMEVWSSTTSASQQPSLGRIETSLRAEPWKCFIEAIQPIEAAQRPQRQRINTIHYSEALTSDEVLEQLKEEEMEKKKCRDEKPRREKKGITKKTRIQITEDTLPVIEDENYWC